MTILQYIPVDRYNWTDLEKLFEDNDGPHDCWCMVWRKMEAGEDDSDSSVRKNSLRRYIDNEFPVGLICYANSEPIAWCSIAPRESYNKLKGDSSLPNVWALVCLYVSSRYKNAGLAEKLISEALKYARDNGAKFVEAYPFDTDSPGYRFMEFMPEFEKMGFNFINKAGNERNLMSIAL